MVMNNGVADLEHAQHQEVSVSRRFGKHDTVQAAYYADQIMNMVLTGAGDPSSYSDDVLSAGTVGLLHAIDRFDPDQGVRFETYALQRIRGAIIDTIRSLSPAAPCMI